MSYNGIGLQTPRGSGTNGHISRNQSSIRQRAPYATSSSTVSSKSGEQRAPDLSILLHESKRQLQNNLLVYRSKLEDEDPPLATEEIDSMVSKYRRELEEKSTRKTMTGSITLKPYQTHEISVSKAKELDNFRSALNVGPSEKNNSAARSKRPHMSSVDEHTHTRSNKERRHTREQREEDVVGKHSQGRSHRRSRDDRTTSRTRRTSHSRYDKSHSDDESSASDTSRSDRPSHRHASRRSDWARSPKLERHDGENRPANPKHDRLVADTDTRENEVAQPFDRRKALGID